MTDSPTETGHQAASSEIGAGIDASHLGGRGAVGAEATVGLSLSDTSVMEALRDGDDDAIAIIVERYQNELVGYFYNQCWNQTVAEELAHVVFIKVFKARARYQPMAKVRTYLYRIAHNAWIDHIRRKKPSFSLDAEIGSSGLRVIDTMADESRDTSEGRLQVLRDRIQAAVDTLAAGQREVFILANNQGLKYHEIAVILEIPEGTVKSRMHTAVRHLRKQLSDLEDEL